MADLSLPVKIWWGMMSVVGTLNIGLWLYARRRLGASRSTSGADDLRYRRWQWWMSGFYVLGCASRSFVLRADVRRLAMFDSWIATVLVGRTIATVAEICFVVQWALLLGRVARHQRHTPARMLSRILVPLIVVAEIFSWYGVLSTNYLGHVIEESIWTVTAFLFVLGLGLCYRRADAALRRCIVVAAVLGAGYIGFMTLVDVPNYLTRWEADEAAGRTYLTIGEGFHDIQRQVVSGRWEDWKYEMVWMSLYFSLAVWMSLALIFWPRLGSDEP